MRELDEVLVRYLDLEYPRASPGHRAAFERLLDMQDPEIFGYLVGRLVPGDPELNDVVASLRRA
jgi:antitoxin CptB